MHSGGSAQFQPAHEAVPAILESLGRADISFNALAANHNTTPEALALWMIRPDIRERIEATGRVVTWRTRLVASNNLTAAIGTLTAILEDFNTHTRATDAARATDRGSERSVPVTPDASSSTQRAELLDLRRAENARRAANSLLRLANFQPNTYACVEAAAHQPARARTAPTTARPQPEPVHATEISIPPIPTTPATPPPQAHEHPAPTDSPIESAPQRAPEPALNPAPISDRDAFDHHLAQIFELASQNPELLESLAAIASPDYSSPTNRELQPTGPPEHWP